MDVSSDIKTAQDEFRQATIDRLIAEREWYAAESALYEAWQQNYGSQRYKSERYCEDRARIQREEGTNW